MLSAECLPGRESSGGRSPPHTTTIPFSSMSWFNLDFRESKPKFLSPNSSPPWPRQPPLRVFTRDVRLGLGDMDQKSYLDIFKQNVYIYRVC